jgi:hypothetical protein
MLGCAVCSGEAGCVPHPSQQHKREMNGCATTEETRSKEKDETRDLLCLACSANRHCCGLVVAVFSCSEHSVTLLGASVSFFLPNLLFEHKSC